MRINNEDFKALADVYRVRNRIVDMIIPKAVADDHQPASWNAKLILKEAKIPIEQGRLSDAYEFIAANDHYVAVRCSPVT